MTAEPSSPRIVIIGAGFAGLEAAFHLRKRLSKRAQLTVVSESAYFLYRPGLAYVPFGKDSERYTFPVAPVLDRRRIFFVHDRVERLDLAARVVQATGREVPYDHLLIATGAAARSSEVPGLAEHTSSIRTAGEAERLGQALRRLVGRAASGARVRVLLALPPGNGFSVCLTEIALLLDAWLRRRDVRPAFELAFATPEVSCLEAFGPRAGDLVGKALVGRGVRVLTGRALAQVEAGRALFTDGSLEGFDLLITDPPHVAGLSFVGLPHDERGFLRTELRTREVLGHPEIYAIGDAGDFPLKDPFLALLEAGAAAEHLAERILGELATAAFDPVSVCFLDAQDTAVFVRAPLRATGDAAHPVAVREDAIDPLRLGSGEVWRAGKKLLSSILPRRFRLGQPFHAGATWSVLEAGLKVMATAFAG